MKDLTEQVEAPPIIYIGGTGRSGTNFLKSLFGRSESVFALPFEHRILIDPEGLVGFYRAYTNAWSPYKADYQIRQLQSFLTRMGKEPLLHKSVGSIVSRIPGFDSVFTGPRYHGWNLSKTFPTYFQELDRFMEELVDFEYDGRWTGSPSFSVKPSIIHAGPMNKDELAQKIGLFINSLVRECLAKNQKSVFVEDNTWNILFAEDLLAFNEQSKLIHIYRQPRDVIASFLEQAWAPSDIEQAAKWYVQVISKWFEVRKQIPKDRLLEIQFEQLIRDPGAKLKTLSKFSGVDLEKFAGFIDTENAHIDRWKKDLSSKQIDIMNTEISQIEQLLGY